MRLKLFGQNRQGNRDCIEDSEMDGGHGMEYGIQQVRSPPHDDMAIIFSHQTQIPTGSSRHTSLLDSVNSKHHEDYVDDHDSNQSNDHKDKINVKEEEAYEGTTGVVEDVWEPEIEPQGNWQKFYYNWLVVDKSTIGVPFSRSFLNNNDLKPVEGRRRIWGWQNFFYFWLADCFNINTWQVASSGMQIGLNWWQCWISIWIGYFCTGIFVVLASRFGAAYHVCFPVSVRASFGIYFSVWPIINRVVMAVVWYSVQAWLGGTLVSLLLRSIFGNDLNTRIPDHFGSQNATTFEFMSFFIFWVISIPFLLIPPHKLKYLFAAKAALVPFAAFGFLIWAVVKSHGHLAMGDLSEYHPHGSAFSWVFIRSLIGCLANFATLIVNAPDFSRFSTTPNSSSLVQLISIPFLFSLTCLIGILVTAAGYRLYGVNYWSPIDVLGKFLETSYTSGTRAGVFLIVFVFTLAQLGTNISANSLSCGTDLTAILPRFINIKRGSLFCAAIALCICPWNMMASSSKFTMALSAYAIFLSSIAGVVCCDYFLVRRGYIKLMHLYSNQKGSFYMYGNKWGINWRALVAYIVSIAPNLPGFVGTVGAPQITIGVGALRIYYLNYWVGYAVAFLTYGALCYIWPVPGTPVKNFLKEKGWYQYWANVEDFEHEWRLTMMRKDLLDDEVDLAEANPERIFY
ncbi:uracil permease [Zygosaccharomyces mellis]|uniref:Uracil permease n=1 Tax=Zygosaccharomyces mellis TaxID=42258 RepID=A0A4C2E6P4_9SACH|nr:uracil permease [Zygosaccharomyces mellis]